MPLAWGWIRATACSGTWGRALGPSRDPKQDLASLLQSSSGSRGHGKSLVLPAPAPWTCHNTLKCAAGTVLTASHGSRGLSHPNRAPHASSLHKATSAEERQRGAGKPSRPSLASSLPSSGMAGVALLRGVWSLLSSWRVWSFCSGLSILQHCKELA